MSTLLYRMAVVTISAPRSGNSSGVTGYLAGATIQSPRQTPHVWLDELLRAVCGGKKSTALAQSQTATFFLVVWVPFVLITHFHN